MLYQYLHHSLAGSLDHRILGQPGIFGTEILGLSLCFGPLWNTLSLRQTPAKLPNIFFTFHKEKSRDPRIWQYPVPENPGIENLDSARA